jgi:hypothetical protein
MDDTEVNMQAISVVLARELDHGRPAQLGVSAQVEPVTSRSRSGREFLQNDLGHMWTIPDHKTQVKR